MTRGRRDGGQATVELALVLPFLVLFILLVIQCALVARDDIELSHAARVAVRAAVETPSGGAVTVAARRASDLDPARLGVTLSGGHDIGDQVTVIVHYVSVTDVPLVGRLLPDVGFTDRLSAEVG